MNKCRYQEAKRTINFARVFALLFIVMGVGGIFFVNEDSTPSNPLWERVFMLVNEIVVPMIFLRTLQRLSSEIRIVSYEIFECRYSMKVVSPFFVWAGITFAITSINNVEIIKVRAYIVQAIMIGLGIGWFFLSKYWLKKELERRKEKYSFNREDNCYLLCGRCNDFGVWVVRAK